MMDSRAETVSEALEVAALRWPGKVFVRDGSTEVTFAGLRDMSDRVACALLQRGLRPGDRIAVASPNRVEWVYLFFAAMKIGLPVVNLSTRYREMELDHMLNQAEARLVVTPSEADGFDLASLYESLRGRAPHLEHVVFLDGAGFDGSTTFSDLTADIDHTALRAAASKVTPASVALISYTSGTTGIPKGAILTHRNLLTTVGSLVDMLGLDDADTFVGSLPLSHVGGVTCGPLGALLAGSELVMMAAFSAERALQIITDHRATVFFGAPTMYLLMLDRAATYDLTSIRQFVIGTSNAPPVLCERLVAAVPSAQLWNIYGLTEASGVAVATRADDDLDSVAHTIGVPMAHVEARVVDADGNAVGPGVTGELQLRGEGICRGYWNAPDATAASFLPGGWLATGDAVAARPDGHLELRGRLKEMFIRGGFNIYPIEIENLLATHPKVAAVAGIGVPDPVLGEVGRYFVVPQEGTAVPDEEELREFCRGRVADYKIPDQIELLDRLPLTTIGKIDKLSLRTRA